MQWLIQIQCVLGKRKRIERWGREGERGGGRWKEPQERYNLLQHSGGLMLHQELNQNRNGTYLSPWWLSVSMATAQIDANFRIKNKPFLLTVHIPLSHGLGTQPGTNNISSVMNSWRLWALQAALHGQPEICDSHLSHVIPWHHVLKLETESRLSSCAW